MLIFGLPRSASPRRLTQPESILFEDPYHSHTRAPPSYLSNRHNHLSTASCTLITLGRGFMTSATPYLACVPLLLYAPSYINRVIYRPTIDCGSSARLFVCIETHVYTYGRQYRRMESASTARIQRRFADTSARSASGGAISFWSIASAKIAGGAVAVARQFARARVRLSISLIGDLKARDFRKSLDLIGGGGRRGRRCHQS